MIDPPATERASPENPHRQGHDNEGENHRARDHQSAEIGAEEIRDAEAKQDAGDCTYAGARHDLDIGTHIGEEREVAGENKRDCDQGDTDPGPHRHFDERAEARRA